MQDDLISQKDKNIEDLINSAQAQGKVQKTSRPVGGQQLAALPGLVLPQVMLAENQITGDGSQCCRKHRQGEDEHHQDVQHKQEFNHDFLF